LRRLTQRAIAPSELRPEVGPALDRLVLRCLKERPEDRWASAEQTLAALEDAVSAAVARPSAIFPKVRSCTTRTGLAEASGVAEVPTAQGQSQA
jgi:hypothetical protein